MTWSYVLNNFDEEIPEGDIEQQGQEHPAYPNDIREALALARKLGLKSGAITGVRVINPYGDNEVVDVSVRGMVIQTDFIAAVKRDITAGPDGH